MYLCMYCICQVQKGPLVRTTSYVFIIKYTFFSRSLKKLIKKIKKIRYKYISTLLIGSWVRILLVVKLARLRINVPGGGSFV